MTGTDKKEKRGEAIGKRVRYFRKKKGLSQKQLADAVAVSTSVISNLENGKSIVGVYTLLDLMDVLEISVEQLLPEYSDPGHASKSQPSDMSGLFEDFPSDQRQDIITNLRGFLDSLGIYTHE